MIGDNISPKLKVAATRVKLAEYPIESPFHPDDKYPEYPFKSNISKNVNSAYLGVRKALQLLKYDIQNLNTPHWNPLKDIISPGMTVFIKPNFVLSRHAKDGNVWSIITHPSVLRAVIDYCWISLKGSGKIILGDAPQYDCNFEELSKICGLFKLVDFYHSQSGPEFELLDLRKYWSRGKHFASMKEFLAGDPKGNISVNLKKQSALFDLNNPQNVYGAVYNRNETISHHTEDSQYYEISRTIMESDVYISVPKLKVHKKVGVTLNIKGLVGINTNKNLIVHYRIKPPKQGGDQYPDDLFTPMEAVLIKTERWMYDNFLSSGSKILEYLHRSIYWIHNHTTKLLGLKVEESKRLLDSGNWHGNDTAWRMSVDLAKIIYYCDDKGNINDSIQRKMFTFIDGIIGGENNGPLMPDSVHSGVIIAGNDFIATDIVATKLMGIDPFKLKIYDYLIKDIKFNFLHDPYEAINLVTDITGWENCLSNNSTKYCNYKPHPGWVGHIENN